MCRPVVASTRMMSHFLVQRCSGTNWQKLLKTSKNMKKKKSKGPKWYPWSKQLCLFWRRELAGKLPIQIHLQASAVVLAIEVKRDVLYLPSRSKRKTKTRVPRLIPEPLKAEVVLIGQYNLKGELVEANQWKKTPLHWSVGQNAL